MRKMSGGRRAVLIVLSVVLLSAAVIAGWQIAENIEEGKLTARGAFYQAIEEGEKIELGGVAFYENNSIGRNNITWKRRGLEAPPPAQALEWLTEKRVLYTQQEALEYARYLREAENAPKEEELIKIVHLKRDNLWMFCYWMVDYEGGVSGYVVDGNTGDILKGWIEE